MQIQSSTYKTLDRSNESNKIQFTGTLDKVLTSKKTFAVSKFAEENSALFGVIIGTILATTIRPFLIMITPGAKKEDKQYASTKSIVSAMVSLCTSLLISLPVTYHLKDFKKNEYLDESNLRNKQEKLMQSLDSVPEYIKNFEKFKKFSEKKFEAFNFLVGFAISFAIAPITQKLGVKALGLVTKKLFPQKQTPKAEPKMQNKVMFTQNSKNIFVNFVDSKDGK